MPLIDYNIQKEESSLPQVTSKNTFPNYYQLTFISTGSHDNSITIKQQAKLLVEHMDIITESRNLIKQKKVITWDELLEKDAKEQ
ncbi:MAG: hypothetical protein Q7T54_04905 [Candidatus Levybacteria bacterium]|nr:hypothetical protein [Candidatus Levybacteria bacterium]